MSAFGGKADVGLTGAEVIAIGFGIEYTGNDQRSGDFNSSISISNTILPPRCRCRSNRMRAAAVLISRTP